MRDGEERMPLWESIAYLATAGILTYFFAAPIKNAVTETVRPHFERLFGESEPESRSVHWYVEQP